MAGLPMRFHLDACPLGAMWTSIASWRPYSQAVSKVSFTDSVDVSEAKKVAHNHVQTNKPGKVGANGHIVTVTGGLGRPKRTRTLSALAEVSSLFTGQLSDKSPGEITSTDDAFSFYTAEK